MKHKLTPYQKEKQKQRKEHPRLPEKYLRMIAKDHIKGHYKEKKN